MLREGNRRIKEQFEMLLQGGRIRTPIDEQIVNNQLDHNESAIWSLLLASGYESGFGRYDVVLEPKPRIQMMLLCWNLRLEIEERKAVWKKR